MKEMKEDSFLGFKPKMNTRIAGVYKLIHIKTGKLYIGSTGNFRNRRRDHVCSLRRGDHHIQALQDLYNDDPNFKFEFFISGLSFDDKKSRELAYDHEQLLLNEYAGSVLLLNRSLNSRLSILPPELLKKRLANAVAAQRTEEYRKKRSIISKAITQTKEARERSSELSLNQWRDPEVRAKHMATRGTKEHRARNIQISIDLGISKKIQINGKIYDSISEASRALNIARVVIRKRCISKEPQFNDYQLLN
jgi:group I intron endonuclease